VASSCFLAHKMRRDAGHILQQARFNAVNKPHHGLEFVGLDTFQMLTATLLVSYKVANTRRGCAL